MAFVSEIILFLTIIIFPFGQLLRLNFPNFSFPLIDITICCLALFNIFQQITKHQLKIKNKYFLYFLIFTWISFSINFVNHHSNFSPFFYLLRLTSLISFFIFPLNFKNKKLSSLFIISIISNIFFGLIQYFLWPNFTYFDSLNWDPHLFRLVSTFFDPTFTAFIYLTFLIYFFLNSKIPYRWPLLIITYFAMALTYSRSTYLAFILAFTFIALKLKNPKIFIFSLILILTTIFILPRQPGEGTKLERTSSIKAKIVNYQEGISIFFKSPIIGHGYNNLSLIRNIKITNSHSNNGFDSSLLTILVTTGIIGFIFFILGLHHYFQNSDLIHQAILLSLLIHSLFANSLLYPWILLSLVLI